MENSTSSNEVPVNTTPVGQPKTNIVPIIFAVVLSAIVFGFAGYYFGHQSNKAVTQPIETDAITGTPNTSVPNQNPTVIPASSTESTYTYNTFSFSYPKTWQLFDATTNPEFFTKSSLTGFDRLVALQNGDYYLVVGIDTQKTGAEAGGIFTSDADYQESLKNNDEININGEKFFLWKGDTRLSYLSDPNREAGIFSLASLSEYIPNKITNQQKETFNGYDDYIQNKNGYAYMFIKLSTNGNTITPPATQAEIKKILESIRW